MPPRPPPPRRSSTLSLRGSSFQRMALVSAAHHNPYGSQEVPFQVSLGDHFSLGRPSEYRGGDGGRSFAPPKQVVWQWFSYLRRDRSRPVIGDRDPAISDQEFRHDRAYLLAAAGSALVAVASALVGTHNALPACPGTRSTQAAAPSGAPRRTPMTCRDGCLGRLQVPLGTTAAPCGFYLKRRNRKDIPMWVTNPSARCVRWPRRRRC
jgi:hypothetical protein